MYLPLKSQAMQWLFQNLSDVINTSHTILRNDCKHPVFWERLSILFFEKALSKRAPQADYSTQKTWKYPTYKCNKRLVTSQLGVHTTEKWPIFTESSLKLWGARGLLAGWILESTKPAKKAEQDLLPRDLITEPLKLENTSSIKTSSIKCSC